MLQIMVRVATFLLDHPGIMSVLSLAMPITTLVGIFMWVTSHPEKYRGRAVPTTGSLCRGLIFALLLTGVCLWGDILCEAPSIWLIVAGLCAGVAAICFLYRSVYLWLVRKVILQLD